MKRLSLIPARGMNAFTLCSQGGPAAEIADYTAAGASGPAAMLARGHETTERGIPFGACAGLSDCYLPEKSDFRR
jgi:hypothetical protein